MVVSLSVEVPALDQAEELELMDLEVTARCHRVLHPAVLCHPARSVERLEDPMLLSQLPQLLRPGQLLSPRVVETERGCLVSCSEDVARKHLRTDMQGWKAAAELYVQYR